ncbi:DNA/RNA non-specific endonuclease [Collinsella intestinalis]|uniref:DNA/RNA non-specific endonuclease n=1 Tax=Collinsella intestinalis TaxID=147207 RepID=UPI0026731E1B|nr:DNA/RNA non-specific endonuclease [Collinsella intestinalis]
MLGSGKSPLRLLRTRCGLCAVGVCLILLLSGCGRTIVHTSSPEGLSTAQQDLLALPEYAGEPYVEVSGNIPSFTDADLSAPDESYAPLDSLGRCGTAMAIVSRDTMPTEERGSIGMVKPSGWHTVRYDDLISDRYLYNRCHLIGYQLTAENANEQNLITGTRYLNVEGMLPFENEVADYVEETGNCVLYRVTPIFVSDELVARGVHMEAKSVEDGGAGVSFNVFCHNVQPGVEIDYQTGRSRRSQDAGSTGESSSIQPSADQVAYALNVNSGKFHLPDCPSVGKMADHNKSEVASTYDQMIADGYSPCANCLSR